MAVFEGLTLRWTGDRVLDPRQIRSTSRTLSVSKSSKFRMPREERLKDWHIDWRMSRDPSRPFVEFPEMTPVCVEVSDQAESLVDFLHPDNAVYVFGPEDGNVSKGLRTMCHRFVSIPSKHCLNLACAVNVVLYDRMAKQAREETEEAPSMSSKLGPYV
jgi:hypothetical protein